VTAGLRAAQEAEGLDAIPRLQRVHEADAAETLPGEAPDRRGARNRRVALEVPLPQRGEVEKPLWPRAVERALVDPARVMARGAAPGIATFSGTVRSGIGTARSVSGAPPTSQRRSVSPSSFASACPISQCVIAFSRPPWAA